MDFDELLSGLGERLGIEDLRANDDGVCAITVRDIAIYFYSLPEENAVYLRADIGPLPTVDAEAFYAAMLRGNNCFEGTGGATLALNDETGKLVLNRLDRLDTLSAEDFADLVERFANAAELWAKLLEASESGEEGAPTEDTEPSADDDAAKAREDAFFTDGFLRI